MKNTTVNNSKPTIKIFAETSTQNSISFDIDVLDNDRVGSITAIELYNGSNLVDSFDLSFSKWPEAFTFENLFSNTNYTIKVLYTYDLHDGTGSHEIVATSNYPTLGEGITITGIRVLNKTYPKVGEEIHVRILLDNPSKISIRSFVVNGHEINVAIDNVTTSAIVKFIPNDFPGGVYEIAVNELTYISYGKVVMQSLTSGYIDNIIVLGGINAVRLYNNNDNIIFENRSDNVILIEFDNPTNYDLSSVVINYVTYLETEITKIDQNTISVPWKLNDRMLTQISLSQFTYRIKGNELRSTKKQYISNHFVVVISDVVRQISTVEQLQIMESHYIYELTNDLDFLGKTWNPYEFNGVFLGNNYKIKNLAIIADGETKNKVSYGLFSLYNGVINGLHIEDIYVSLKTEEQISFGSFATYFDGTINDSSVSGTITVNGKSSSVGGFIGSCSYVTIANSHNSGNVSGTSGQVGGFVGRSDSWGCITIASSHNSGNVSGTSGYVGGFVGLSGAHDSGSRDGIGLVTITNSYNSGDVSGIEFIGGFVGCSLGGITAINSYNSGNVTGTSNKVGGFAGTGSYVTIRNSYNSGSISGEACVGGFIGLNAHRVTIANSYNSGNVSGRSSYVGGFVGWSYSYTGYGNATITNSYNSGRVSGEKNVGGFVGYSYSDSKFNASNVTITNSYNCGTVTGTSVNVGGFVGYWYSDSSKVSVTITNSYNSSSVSGEKNVGGFVGRSDGWACVTITNSYNSGSVDGTELIGLFVGSSEYGSGVTITNSYNRGLSFVDAGFFTNILMWDSEIWDLININVVEGLLPKILTITIS